MRLYAPRMTTSKLTRLEKFLLYSLFPWLFFGLIVLPLSGVSFFGISSGFSSSSSIWMFPLALLFGNAIFGFVLSWQYSNIPLFVPKQSDAKQAIAVTARESPNSGRRSFLEKGVLALGALVFLVSGIDSLLTSGATNTPSSSPSGTPINLSSAPPIFDDPRLASLVDSEVTSADDFYRVSIDLFDPSVDVSSWSLQVNGLVANPKTYTISQLQALPKMTQYNTFECVSNDINGNLISNAEWGGVRLSDLFNDVGGLSPGADYVVFYSVDGYSVGIPLAKALMQDSMVAYEMNHASLPQSHGFPLRGVIPGLYGMMSAKWIRRIQVVSSTYLGYWQTRGWSNVGTVQTLAFITIPSQGSTQGLSQNNGTIMLGGYAYAGDRGISRVEVSIDGGNTWQEATLKPAISKNTWTLWAYEWQPTKTGIVDIYARATDGNGATQTSNITSTFPNGATGYATIAINVTK